jgi:hypothetical protein
MAELEVELSAYESMREKLEAEHMGKWVLLRARDLVGLYDSFDAAAEDAVRRFGSGPYLIRQIGAPPLSLPASVMYAPDHGTNKMRI